MNKELKGVRCRVQTLSVSVAVGFKSSMRVILEHHWTWVVQLADYSLPYIPKCPSNCCKNMHLLVL